eukprot:8725089-Lingulodinium_polyedra.AAC.1
MDCLGRQCVSAGGVQNCPPKCGQQQGPKWQRGFAACAWPDSGQQQTHCKTEVGRPAASKGA